MAAIGYLGKPCLKVRGEISTELRVTSDEDLGPRLKDPVKILNFFFYKVESKVVLILIFTAKPIL